MAGAGGRKIAQPDGECAARCAAASGVAHDARVRFRSKSQSRRAATESKIEPVDARRRWRMKNSHARISRRRLLGAAGGLALGGGVAVSAAAWKRNERGQRASVFIGAADGYDADLAGVISAGLHELGVT